MENSTREFIIALNPQPLSKLPYLVHIPLGRGLWLKAAGRWPRAARIYCHALDGSPPAELDVVERAPVLICERRGRAIDLVLDRGANKRSQFVFATSNGRQLIFWQTAQSAQAARPGLRVPASATPSNVIIYADTRERYGYTFARNRLTVERKPLAVGDYAAEVDGRTVGVVERKTLDNFVRSLVDGALAMELTELSSVPHAAIVVEGCYSAILRHRYTPAGFLPSLIAQLNVRYPDVAINYLESRKIAEDWTARYLLAAYAYASDLPLLPS